MDFVARYAGDEFVVVLPRADEATADEVVQRIRRAVAQFAWEWGEVELGISIGQAIYPGHATDPKHLLGVADGRMYVDKSSRKKEHELRPAALTGPAEATPAAVGSPT